MISQELIFWTLTTGVLSALATGLGAIPVVAMGEKSQRFKGFSSALAAGMMLAASVFSLAQKGLQVGAYKTILGILFGALFVYGLQVRAQQVSTGQPQRSQSWWILLVMFIHSFPEGVAIGVGFATGDFGFGMVMALAISIHNIPEGVAISLPLRAEGAGFWRCFWASVFSSLPQPVACLPALFFAAQFSAILPLGLGFAGGAMIYVACAELIPDAVEQQGRPLTGLGVCLGLIGMMTMSLLLESAV